MQTLARLAVAAAVALVFCVTPPAGAQTKQGPQARDEEVLRKLVTAQTEAWNRHDAAAWSKDFAPDATFINIVGSVFTGREEIERRHAAIFAGMFKDSHSEVAVSSVRFVAPGVALVDTEHVVKGYTGLPPGVQPTEPGVLRTRMRYVLKQTGGRWWIVAGQNTDMKPVPAKPAPASGTPPAGDAGTSSR